MVLSFYLHLQRLLCLLTVVLCPVPRFTLQILCSSSRIQLPQNAAIHQIHDMNVISFRSISCVIVISNRDIFSSMDKPTSYYPWALNYSGYRKGSQNKFFFMCSNRVKYLKRQHPLFQL